MSRRIKCVPCLEFRGGIVSIAGKWKNKTFHAIFTINFGECWISKSCNIRNPTSIFVQTFTNIIDLSNMNFLIQVT